MQLQFKVGNFCADLYGLFWCSQASLLAEWNSPPPGLKLIPQADAMEIGAPTSQAETGPSGS
jgi:hypothetical protein